MQIISNPVEMLKQIHELLGELDYRITGLTAVNLYGYGINTNVFDIVVESDKAVHTAVDKLELKNPAFEGYDPYIWKHEDGDNSFYIKIQGDLMGTAVLHPIGLKLHSKELIMKRLEVYSDIDGRVLKALAFIALTLDEEKTEKYKEYWNRL
jgi:hypothetical protein